MTISNENKLHFVSCEAVFVDRVGECKPDVAVVTAHTENGDTQRYMFNPYLLERQGLATATTDKFGHLDFTFDTKGLLNLLNDDDGDSR